MTEDQEDQIYAAFKSLAEELFRLSHIEGDPRNWEERQEDECYNLASLFRIIPTLCQYNISGVYRLVELLEGLQDKGDKAGEHATDLSGQHLHLTH